MGKHFNGNGEVALVDILARWHHVLVHYVLREKATKNVNKTQQLLPGIRSGGASLMPWCSKLECLSLSTTFPLV